MSINPKKAFKWDKDEDELAKVIMKELEEEKTKEIERLRMRDEEKNRSKQEWLANRFEELKAERIKMKEENKIKEEEEKAEKMKRMQEICLRDGAKKREEIISKNKDELLSCPGAKVVTAEDIIESRFNFKIFRDEVAVGSYSKIYKAINTNNSNQLFVKIIQLSKVNPKLRLNIVDYGSKAYRYLITHHHPNLIKFLEIFSTPEKIYIFMEPMYSVKKLGDKIRFGLIEDLARNYSFQIGDALCFLHDNGIAHRGLSTQHFMITATNSVIMYRFETSRVCINDDGSITQLPVIGDVTPRSAPEEVNASGDINAIKADIWKYGNLVLQMILGEHHFIFKSNESIEAQWSAAKLKPNLKKKCLKPLLDTILIKEPNDRPEMYKIIVDSWFKYLLNCEI